MYPGEPPRRVLTVSELTILVRDTLEVRFSDLWVEGEVSNLRAPGSGHLYFTLKDHSSQIRAVLFRSASLRLRFALRDGMQVIARGRLTVYEPRGEYQLVIESLEPKGLGALQLAFEQLKERLAWEGLFSPDRKRPLPAFPGRVGVVTSLDGAAVRDIVSVLRRRCPILSVLIVPVPVQGEGAAARIAEAIRMLSLSGLVDVMIVGRGGGSLEDLWSFNEEVVVRAIAESKVPVVSAVGHEIDYTLADFAADYRAATPSAAAEAIAPVLDEVVERLHELMERARRAVRLRLAAAANRLQSCRSSFAIGRLRVQRESQRLDDMRVRLMMGMRKTLAGMRQRVSAFRHALLVQSPLAPLKEVCALVPQLLKRLKQQMDTVLRTKRQALRSRLMSLEGLSPLAILKRGYSIVHTVPDGHLVRRADDVSMGDEVQITLSVGRLLCAVQETWPDSST
ncbi:MAG TPA: exodeoxyribonuclease VII large subunit [Nitrospiraceae bacterium]|jgi:exodeoxyribonuclease VII large subunit|nr:exodeoxyribonuclease VII large subunit [Nitrospiraceae bacterium]